MKTIQDDVAVVVAYAGGDAITAARRMIEGLEALYLEDLRSISAQDLPAKQGALKQLAALKKVFSGEANIPRV